MSEIRSLRDTLENQTRPPPGDHPSKFKPIMPKRSPCKPKEKTGVHRASGQSLKSRPKWENNYRRN